MLSEVEFVGGADDAVGAAVEDVGVDHGRLDVAVAEEFLDGADVVSVLEEVGGEGVAQGVTGGGLGDARGSDGLFHGPLNHGRMEVVAATLSKC